MGTTVIRNGQVGINGLRSLARDLKAADDALVGELKAADKRAAVAVVTTATSIGEQLGGVAAHVVKGGVMRANATAATASVSLSGDTHSEGPKGPAFGAEYGSRKFHQFGPWRGSGDNAGYFLWPAVRRMRPVVAQDVQSTVDRLMRGPFPEPMGG